MLRSTAVKITIVLMAITSLLGLFPGVSAAASGEQSLVGKGGLCLDVPYADPSNGTDLWMWRCNGTAAQSFTYDAVKKEIRVLGKCLDIEGRERSGSDVQITLCGYTGNLDWYPTASGEIRTERFPGLCLDVRGGRTAERTKVQMWDCNDTAAQKWSLDASTSGGNVGALTNAENGTATVDRSPQQGEFQRYARMLEANNLNPNAVRNRNQRYVIGLRDEDQLKGEYDDKIVVIWTDRSGTRHVETFKANLESDYYEYKNKGFMRDVNGDGVHDFPTLKAGVYTYAKDGKRYGHDYYRPTAVTPVLRDTDRDGKGDRLDRTGAGLSILFHVGGRDVAGPGDKTGSAGCQTMPTSEYTKFLRALGGDDRFQYLVVDV